MKISDKNNIPEFLSKLKEISNNEVQIGLFGSDDGEVVKYAGSNEFGDSSEGVPERSFLRSAIDENESKIKRFSGAVVDNSISGNASFDAGGIGEYVVGIVREQIVKVDTPPNSPATIARKKSSNPLIDTGVMLRSVTFKIKGK